MINARILVRKGLKADFDPTKMLPGEWAVSIDASTSNQIVWMCFAPGVCKRMGTYEDFQNMVYNATGQIIERYEDAFGSILEEVNTNAEAVSANTDIVLVAKSDIINTYLPQIKSYVSNASASASEAKTYSENAKASASEADKSAEDAKKYSQNAFSTTPEGYEVLVGDVDLLKNSIIQTTERTLYGSNAGGIKLIGIGGASEQEYYEGKNKIDVEDTTFTTTDNTEKELVSNVHLIADTYTLSWTQSADLTSNTRNTPLYRVSDDSSSTVWQYSSENQNLSAGRKSWTFEITEENDYSFLYWVHTASNDVTMSDFQLEAGDTATDYEPYVGGTQSPNPNYPQEIESSGDIKNLLDLSGLVEATSAGIIFTPEYTGGLLTSISAKGTLTGKAEYILGKGIAIADWLKAGDYILSAEENPPCAYIYIYFHIYSNEACTTVVKANYLYDEPITISILEEYITNGYYIKSGIVAANGTEIDSNFKPMLRKASVSNAEYKPYGYSLGIKASGKNLLPTPYAQTTKTNYGMTFTVNEDYSVSVSGTPTDNATLKLFEGISLFDSGKVCFSIGGEFSNVGLEVIIYDEQGTTLFTTTVKSQVIVNMDNYSSTVFWKVSLKRLSNDTVVSGVLYPMIRKCDSDGNPIGDDTYAPYQSKSITIPLNEPLRGIGEVKDEIVCQDGVWGVLRRIGSDVLNGSEAWNVNTTYGYYTAPMFENMQTFSNVVCDYFRNDRNNGIWVGSTAIAIQPFGGITTSSEIKAWVTENPITVQYELATPTFEPFTDQTPFYDLESFDTVTYISTDSEVEPNVILKFAKTEGDAVTLLNYNQTNLNRIAIAELTSAVLALNQE